MPIINVNLFEGLSVKQKDLLIKETSETVANVLDTPLSTVRVLIHEVPKENWGIAGNAANKMTKDKN